MSQFPTANFTGTDDGLFTVAEIRRLMAAEFDRSLRYQYPLVLMAIGIDRLDHLQDLYGFESKAVILRSVTDLLQAVSRSSDFLGCLVDDHILAMFPHANPEGASLISRRLLSGSRKLKFDGDGHTLQVTLSVGASHNQTVTPHGYEELTRAAQEALTQARAGGGDRYVVREPSLIKDGPPASSPGTGQIRVESVREAVPILTEEDQVELFDRIRAYLVAQGDLVPAGGPNIDGKSIEKEILSNVLESLRKEHPPASSAAPDQSRQIQLLERRIQKLSDSLTSTEAALRTVQTAPSDSGVPSIYKTIQGLGDTDPNAESKKAMMAQIFQANRELRVKSDG